MEWYKRTTEGILTPTSDKIEAPDGLWTKCPSCKKATHHKELLENHYVCPYCEHHYPASSDIYFKLLFDNQQYNELDANLSSDDPLNFKDTKDYPSRIKNTQEKTGLIDAVRTAHGLLSQFNVVIGCMDFQFIGGSMGSVVGEKIARAISFAIHFKYPFIMISRSGGARMMEGALSLMQMAKTSARLAQLSDEGVPYISVLTDPTTGGVTASFAMLGDIHIAEPKALIGFAGPRVIKETIGKELPEGFQRAEFLLEHGFIDTIVNRKELKQNLTKILKLLLPSQNETL